MTAHPKCPLCGAEEPHSYLATAADTILACGHCGVKYSSLVEQSDSAIYSEGYYNQSQSAGYGNYAAEYEAHNLAFTRRLRQTESIMGHKGRLLDCGCALGHLGEAAKNLGWDVVVTDLSAYAVKQSWQSYGLPGFVCDLNELPVREQIFDLISLHDVIEHVPNPKEVLAKLKKTLRPGGFVHITTPNVSSLTARFMKKFWYHYKPGEHLIYFDPRTLTNVLQEIGYRVVSVKAAPTYMRMADVFKRLQSYWPRGARWGLRLAKLLGLDRLICKLFVGEFQVWAQVDGKCPAAKKQPLLELLCCPSCQGDLRGVLSGQRLTCQSCAGEFTIDEGVPDLRIKEKKAA